MHIATSPAFKENAHQALGNAGLQKALARSGPSFIARRAAAVANLPKAATQTVTAVPAQPTAPPASTGSSGYLLQVGAFPSAADAEALFGKVAGGTCTAAEAELFRAQMLTEMAAMSLEDGLVMQLHPGSMRNHNAAVFERFGRDKGADIPTRTDYVHALKPLLDRFGNEAGLSLILFTLDESSYARELAPLAGHYPCLKLGPAWWFHDSPEGMRRFREMTTETAGFYNTVGFNDDTRAFLSIPARHDVARRVDSAFLATLVAEGRMDEDEAEETVVDLTSTLPRRAYKL